MIVTKVTIDNNRKIGCLKSGGRCTPVIPICIIGLAGAKEKYFLPFARARVLSKRGLKLDEKSFKVSGFLVQSS